MEWSWESHTFDIFTIAAYERTNERMDVVGVDLWWCYSSEMDITQQ